MRRVRGRYTYTALLESYYSTVQYMDIAVLT
jgi:hypothetical protein